MYKLILTALAGLLVACTQNSAETLQLSKPSDTTEAPASYTISPITIERKGNMSGRTLVLIPGLASGVSVWDRTAEAFKDYDIRLVQVGGFAGSAAPEGQSVEKVSSAIIEHLNNTPGRDTTLIGHSLGGFLSLKVAMTDSNLINEIIIVDSLPYLAGMMMPGATPEQAKNMAKSLGAQMATMPKVQFQAQQKMGLTRLVKDKSYLPKLEGWSESSEQVVVANLMSKLLAADLRDDLSSLTVPTTVLMAYDTTMGVSKEQLSDLFRAQYSAASNVELEIIEDSYHFIMFDQPEIFQKTIENALEE